MALRVACSALIPARALKSARRIARAYSINMQSASILCTGESADELMEALMCFGASSCSVEGATSFQENDPVPWQSGPRQLWNQCRITALFGPDSNVLESLELAADTLGLKEMPKYELNIVEDSDWVQQVKDAFQPVEVLPRFWIVPEWCIPPEKDAINIMLNPGLAFGTGEHPTTLLCLKWLHKVIKGGENILDYGIGSGILGIAALKMGASHVVGIDIDPMAVSSSYSNAELNKVDLHSFEVFVAKDGDKDPVPHGDGIFDIVVANILLNPLVSLSTRIASYAKSGGVVGLSGIIVEQVEHVVETYSPYLKGIEISEEKGWACVSGIKI